MQNVFAEKLDHAKKLTAEILSSVVLINNKKGAFTITALPPQVQWSPVFSFYTTDFNQDGMTDVVSAGNFYGVTPYEGRYDAGYGNVLLNQKSGSFKIPGSLQTGLIVDGEVRDIKIIKTINGASMIAFARNNDSIKFYKLTGKNVSRLN